MLQRQNRYGTFRDSSNDVEVVVQETLVGGACVHRVTEMVPPVEYGLKALVKRSLISESEQDYIRHGVKTRATIKSYSYEVR